MAAPAVSSTSGGPPAAGGKKGLQVFTAEEVAKHNKLGDLWIIVDNKVYDVSKFANVHPGGKHIFLDLKNGEATEAFYAFHRTEVLDKYHKKLCIGTVEGREEKIYEAKVTSETSKIDIATAAVGELMKHPLWCKTPFGEPASVKKYYASPYYNESHLRFRLAVRQIFVDIVQDCEELEEAGDYVEQEMWEDLAQKGIFACSIGIMAMPYCKKLGIKLPGGVTPEEFDFFHEQILHEESSRTLPPSVNDGLFAGFNIGLPPIINFYHGADKEELIASILLGKKKVCLAITGPEAGSDVAGHTTVARQSEDGKHFIVRGLKKWITGGCQADYFVTAVRTGGKGLKGLVPILYSFLLHEQYFDLLMVRTFTDALHLHVQLQGSESAP
mmetsp:Transcript_26609/g.67048  ORF Transcript_26609/g.67048 Transcript_26609/m.67048 type:complete len:385 (+) Transcript_26609:256-1410(+)